MNENVSEAFQQLKPLCVTLSAVSLRAPNDSRSALHALLTALQNTNRACVTQNFGNYIFFPVKPLLSAGVHDEIKAPAIDVVTWLLQTRWFMRGGDMTIQLLTLFTTLLAKARAEELITSLYRALEELFTVAKEEANGLSCRPTLAHLTTLSLKECISSSTTKSALQMLLQLYTQLNGDAAASFLPGTVSSLSRTILKVHQKSSILTSSLKILEKSITTAFDGEPSQYRTQSWLAATQSQLLLALTPILSSMASVDHEAVQSECAALCKGILTHTNLVPDIFLEFLVQTSKQWIPEKYQPNLASIFQGYTDAMIRILHGTSEDRKLQMLNTMTRAMPQLSRTSQELLSQQVLSQVCRFVQFSSKAQITVHRPHDDESELFRDPDILYISAEVRTALGSLLASCTFIDTINISSPELLWIAQKAGLETYSHALQRLTSEPDLCLQSILQEARFRGRDYRSELIHVLYPIMSLSQPRLRILRVISEACQYDTVQNMLIDNADYIINQLHLAFVTLDINPRIPAVLALVVQLAPEIIELIDDVIASFFDILDDYHAYQAVVESIFAGLHAVVHAASQTKPRARFEIAFNDISQAKMDKSFEERFAEAQNDTNPQVQADDIESDQHSKSYNSVLKIMEKTQLFLSHESSSIKIKALETLLEGIPFIAEDEDKFLPLIHMYWPQLVRRFEDSNPFVVAAVLNVIAKTITFGGSFMRTRLLEDVMPFVRQILHPEKDRRGNVIGYRNSWEGTGRRKVGEMIQLVLKAVVEDGGLTVEEQALPVKLITELSKTSELMKTTLKHVQERDTAAARL